jgi:hypothetical protein
MATAEPAFARFQANHKDTKFIKAKINVKI